MCSLSSRTVVYKGLLTPWQFPQFYEDLRSPDFAARFAIFHQRYSTNTQPSWQLAQPFRYVAHNGEINTVVSNRRWLRAKEREIRKHIGVGKWFHLLEENVSDSASFDNALELKLLEGKSVEAAMLRWCRPLSCTIRFFRRTCARRWRRCRAKASRGMVRRRWSSAMEFPWA